MTIIAFDGRYVAADTQASRGDTRSTRLPQKICVVGGAVYGFCGAAALRDPMVYWMAACRADPKERPVCDDADHKDSQVIRFRPGGQAEMISWNVPYPELYSPPDGFGSNVEFVIGAMMHGASPMEAISYAIKRKVWLGGAIDWVDLSDPELQIHRIAAQSPWKDLV